MWKVLTVILIALVAVTATAQTQEGREGQLAGTALRAELDKARQVLNDLQAKIVSIRNVPPAIKDLLRDANIEWKQARDFHMSGNLERCKFLLSGVRVKIDRIRALLSQHVSAGNAVNLVKPLFRELVGLVDKAVATAKRLGTPEADRLAIQLRNLLGVAKRSLDTGNREAYTKAAREIKATAARIFAMAGIERPDNLKEKAEKAVKRASQALKKAVEKLENDNEKAEQAIAKAKRHLKAARKALKEGRYRKAIAEAETVISILKRIARRAEEPEVDDARHAIARAEKVIARAKNAMQESPCPEGRKLLTKAIEHLEMAKRALKDEKVGVAVRQSQIAAKLAARAIEVCKKNGERRDKVEKRVEARLKKQLKKLSTFIKRVTPGVRESGNKEAGRLLKKAVETAAAARESLGNNQYRRAEKQIVVARTLATKALALAKGRDKAPVTDEPTEEDGLEPDEPAPEDPE